MIKVLPAIHKNDFIQIETLGRIIWEEHYTPIIGAKQVEYMLGKFQSVAAIESQIMEGYEYFKLEYKDNPIGYLSIVKKNDALFLSKFYISKGERGKGIGNFSLNFVVERARGLKFDKIILTVNKYNSKAIMAYEKMGFKTIDSIVQDIGNGFVMDDFVMVKSIN